MQKCGGAASSRCLFPLPKALRIQRTEGNVNGENIPEQRLWSSANISEDFLLLSSVFLLHISQKQKLFVLVVLIWAYFPNKSRVILVINHYASVFGVFSSSKIVNSQFCFNTCDVANVDIFLFIIDVWTSLCQRSLWHKERLFAERSLLTFNYRELSASQPCPTQWFCVAIQRKLPCICWIQYWI